MTWIIETWQNIPDLKLETLSILMKGLGYDPSAPSQKAAYVNAQILCSNFSDIICSAFDLLKTLCTGFEEIEAVTTLLSTESSKLPKTVSYLS